MGSVTLGLVVLGGWFGRVAAGRGPGPLPPAAEAGPTASPGPVAPVPGDPAAAGVDAGQIVFAGLAAVAVFLIVRRKWWRRPVPDRPRPRRHQPLVSVGFVLGTVVAGGIAAQLALHAMGRPAVPGDLADQLRIAIPVYAVNAALAAAWWFSGRATEREVGSVPPVGPVHPARTGLVGLALTWPVAATVSSVAALIIVWRTGVVPEQVAHETLAGIVAEPWAPASLAMIATVVLVVPILEEVVYRGMIQGGFVAAGLRPGIAVGVTAAIFAARHASVAPPHALVALFVMGLGFGWVVERTGRLTAAAVMHAGFNAGNILLALAIAR